MHMQAEMSNTLNLTLHEAPVEDLLLIADEHGSHFCKQKCQGVILGAFFTPTP